MIQSTFIPLGDVIWKGAILFLLLDVNGRVRSARRNLISNLSKNATTRQGKRTIWKGHGRKQPTELTLARKRFVHTRRFDYFSCVSWHEEEMEQNVCVDVDIKVNNMQNQCWNNMFKASTHAHCLQSNSLDSVKVNGSADSPVLCFWKCKESFSKLFFEAPCHQLSNFYWCVINTFK